MFLLACAPPPPAAGLDPLPPDVLVLVLDTVRVDRTSLADAPRDPTPALRRWADQGVRFTRATTPANWTFPSHAALFTGADPHSFVMAEHWSLPSSGWRPPPEAPTLPEWFTARGYETKLVSVNGVLDDALFHRGIEDHAAGMPDEYALWSAELRRYGPRLRPMLLVVNLMVAHDPYVVGEPELCPWISPEQRARAASDRAATHAVARFPPPGEMPRKFGAPSIKMLFADDQFAGIGAHAPLVDGRPFELPAEDLALVEAAYDCGLVYADRAADLLLDDWFAHAPQAIAVVLADHGESLGENERLGHLVTPYPPETDVPLFFLRPGVPGWAGLVVERPVQIQSVFPTLMEIVSPAEALPTDAPSLVATVEEDRPAGPSRVLTFPRDGSRPYPHPDFRAAGAWVLADEGPGVYAAAPAVDDAGRRLPTLRWTPESPPGPAERALLDELTAAAERWRPSPKGGELADEAEAQLRALGYVE